MMDWGDANGSSWWWMVPMIFFMVALVGAVLWAVVAFTRSSGPTSAPDRPTAKDILDERFARGEIDSAEYRDRVSELQGADTVRRA